MKRQREFYSIRTEWLVLGLIAVLWVAQGCMMAKQMQKVPSTSYRATAQAKPSAPIQQVHQSPLEIAKDLTRNARKAKLPAGIEEADLLRVQGHFLYYLHTTKGLLQIDIKDPRRPSIRATMPIYGTPVEMFVEGQRAFILVNDVLLLRQYPGGFRFERQHTSQLLHVDLSVRHDPKTLSVNNIAGRFREGMARKQADTLFVMSEGVGPGYRKWRGRRYPRQEKKLWLAAYDVSNPRAMRRIQRKNVLSTAQVVQGLPWPGMQADYAARFVLTATPEAILVATHWRVKLPGRYTHRNIAATRVDVFRLTPSKEDSRFQREGQIWLAGLVLDQFKQSYYRENGQGIYLGLTLQDHWQRKGRRRWRQTLNHFHSFAVAEDRAPRRLSQLVFGKRFETIRGSAFDLERRMLYAITALEKPPHEIIDPLYAISFKNPAEPQIESQINDLSGDMNLFRFVENRQFLLAVGRDTSGHCTGFGRSQGRSRTAISLIDVRDSKRIRLVQRKCFHFPAIRNILSDTNRNRDQAHKMIGLASEGDTHFVTVPLFFRRQRQMSSGAYQQAEQSAIGLMQWDLRKYDTSLNEQQQRVLYSRGMVLHPEGRVKRTMLIKRNKQRFLLNLSADHLSVASLPRVGRPKSVAILPLHQGANVLATLHGYQVSRYLQGSGKQALSVLTLNHLVSGRRTQWQIRGLQRIIRWRQGLLLIFWRKNNTLQSAHHVRLAPQLHTRYLQMAMGKAPVLHRAKSWELEHLPPMLKASCDASQGNCADGMRVGQIPTQLTLSQGLIWIARGSATIHGMKCTGQLLIWMDWRGKQITQKVFVLPHATRYSLIAAGNGRFFLSHSPYVRYALGALQLWSLQKRRWQRSLWRPMPGHLLSAFEAANPEELRLIAYQPTDHQLALLRWPLVKKAPALLSLHQLQYGALQSFLRMGNNIILTSQRSRESRLSFLQLQGNQMSRMAMVRLPSQAWSMYGRREHVLLRLKRGFLQVNVKKAQMPRLVAYHPGSQPLSLAK